MKEKKTNAMRQLEQAKIPYIPIHYDLGSKEFSGEAASEVIGVSSSEVYKTLTATNTKNDYFVFIIPVDHELDLKKAAKAASQKRIEMVPVKDLLKITGYIRGEVSPLGMKKHYPTYIHDSINSQDIIYISAGKKGYSIAIDPKLLLPLISGEVNDLVK